MVKDQSGGRRAHGVLRRNQRPVSDQMLKDALRRRYDILMVWSRLGRSVVPAANALAELDAAGTYCAGSDRR